MPQSLVDVDEKMSVELAWAGQVLAGRPSAKLFEVSFAMKQTTDSPIGGTKNREGILLVLPKNGIWHIESESIRTHIPESTRESIR